MRTSRNILVLGLLLTLVSVLAIFCKMEKSSPAAEVKLLFEKQLSQLQQTVNTQLYNAVKKGNEIEIKTAFLAARKTYKSIEFYAEYFFPTTAVMLNGPPIDEIELGENLIENPTGFQVMETLIYDGSMAKNRAELLNEIKKMKLNLARMARFNQQYQITDAQVFDAIRLELFRITSLGITGFDTPLALQALPEAAASLKGIHQILTIYQAGKASSLVQKTIKYLQLGHSFNDFDRLTFITDYLQPIGRQLGQFIKKQQIETVAGSSALRNDAYTLFEINAFNTDRFVGNNTLFINNEKIALGKALFSDVILSNNGQRSCQSCHKPEKAFTDGLVKPKNLRHTHLLQRNTPTLTYAGLQQAFFYDFKVGTLEDQALDVVHNKDEMNGSLKEAAHKINLSGKYQSLFKKAFTNSKGKADAWKIQHALASYVRSLSPFTSKVDLYLRGDKSKLNQTEKEGFNLFMGKAKCGTCHFAPLFNGTPAPLFHKSEAEVLGVPSKPDTLNATVDSDLGRYSLSQYPQYKYAFKTTTVRNIAKTAPYMHNGVYNTLEQVIDFYNRGGGAGIGLKLENQTLPPDKLLLSKKEITALILFLKALDDT